MEKYEKRVNELALMFELNDDNDEPRDIVLVCRNVLEKAINLIFDVEEVRKPAEASLLELINNQTVQNFFGNDVILDSLHFIRIVGINAFHGKYIKKTQAKVAYDNTKNMIEFIGNKLVDQSNVKVNVITDNYIQPNKSFLNTPISEAETRKVYIDSYLEEAGWEVVEPNLNTTLSSGKIIKSGSLIPGKACCEIPVQGLLNVSGIGFCDYVLYGKDGKPLAIVEAKKTSVDALKGEQQVREYGRCMEKQCGYVPILYTTNGYDIYLYDGKYPRRKVKSFHAIEELAHLIQKRNLTKILDMNVRDEIAGRPYQKMAITNICERFNNMYRKGLLVMATGTGKTRTAIALVDVLTRNNWVKNVLFLADRTSLVRQAFKNFRKILPDMTYSVISDKSLADEPNARITFSTHQTMINKIDSEDKEFSIGRFDLIVIDEAHRSIFNKYGAIFSYFDSLLVGLTATPKDEVDKNTYDLFECETGVPNYAYSLQEAIDDHYLVPYKLLNRTTKQLKDGIVYDELSDKDKDELDKLTNEDFSDVSIINKNKLFQKIYNTDTCRKVLNDLMTFGLRVEQGQKLGKTIIFAVNHYHANLIVETFNKMYPMYPDYCKLIDNQVKNSEHLIEEFETDPSFRIAVSVDMLDTGIDVPSVLNLVFFKKVNSSIKLIQMIGRGTRLCEGLLDGEDKKHFYIFDYFNNFKDMPTDNVRPMVSISQKLFQIRLEMMCLMQTNVHQQIIEHRNYYLELKLQLMKIVKDIKENGAEKISVRDAMNVLDKYNIDLKWEYISDTEKREIIRSIMPLVESDVKEDYLNLSFDYIMLQIEKKLIENNHLDQATSLIKAVREIAQYLINKSSVSEIRAKLEDLNTLYLGDIWMNPSISVIEHYRKSVRHLMKYLRDPQIRKVTIDHSDQTEQGELVDGPFADIRTYKEKVIDYLIENSDNPTIMKIKNLEPLTNTDFEKLEDILWVQLGNKDDYYKISKLDNLAVFIRSIVGIEQEVINTKFSQYLSENRLSAEQQEFISSIINYVRENGDVVVDVLINESPFDSVDILGLFGNDVPVVKNVINTLHNCIVA